MIDFNQKEDYIIGHGRRESSMRVSKGRSLAMTKSMTRDKGGLLALFACVLIAVSLVAAPVASYANNHQDVRYTRYVGSSATSSYTSRRLKVDASSMYSYNDKSAGSYYAMGVGFASASSTTGHLNTVIDNVLCRKGNAYFIRQNVHELGYGYAALKITPMFTSGSINMLWSADSV